MTTQFWKIISGICGIALLIGVWAVFNKLESLHPEQVQAAQSELSPAETASSLEIKDQSRGPASIPLSIPTLMSKPTLVVPTETLLSNTSASEEEVRKSVELVILEKMKFKKKVFKTSEEENDLLQLARDPESFKLGKAYLENEKNWERNDFEETQNDLVDLFKMGFEQSTSESFSQAMALIADPRLEDQSISPQKREVLAGFQAELMFHLLALNPNYQSAVKQVTQGPVHEKLFQNVNQQLDSNYQDSMDEKAQHERALAGDSSSSL